MDWETLARLTGAVYPAPGVVYIDVWNCRAAVSRYVAIPGGLAGEPATNWEALEDDAIRAVEAQGGAVNWSGHYTCPPDLAEAAVWPETGA